MIEKKTTVNPSTPLLEVKNLQTAFEIDGDLYHAVDDVSFTINENQIIGVVGESGCGKSVMSMSIMRLLPDKISKITNGEVLFLGEDLTKKSNTEMKEICGKDISMIFQEPMTALNPVFTIGYQIQEILLNHLQITKREAKTKSIELLRKVGIPRPEKIINEYPHQLSGGMRQRVMIAIAIACEPKLLIADEPTTALDVTVQAQILDLLKEVQKLNQMAIILITHDLGVVAEMCDEVIVMYAGKIVEKTDVETLFYDPQHPYTQLLIQAIPRLESDGLELSSISGIVPSLQHMPLQGCRFADRCPKALPECKTTTPMLAETRPSHAVACLLYETSKQQKGGKVL